ncbi:MAG TPA: uracil phosphoribosyltransferase [Thermoanaerobaculia bacterium]|nr:uracil phosphoribosyltransferase [Thermoanaerobaculia bacterium]
MSKDLVVVDHPLVLHKLTQMRARETPTANFRRLLKETSMLLGYEATRDLPLAQKEIETPLERMEAPVLENEDVVLVSVLRAGNGILDGMLEIFPSARVGYIGLYRDPDTLEAVQYYVNLPQDMAGHGAIVLDPMLATGHSAHQAILVVKRHSPAWVRFVALVSAPEGIEYVHARHPDVTIYTAAVDRQLNEHGYIMPGLGDAGDRLFGTKPKKTAAAS